MPHVAGTVSLVRDADRVVVVDPGMVADRDLILGPMRELGVRPEDVTDVVVSHHHLDHTLNVALFPGSRFTTSSPSSRATSSPAGTPRASQLTPSIRLLATPGHTPQDITTLAGTADDVVALTHLWWTERRARRRPLPHDREQLREERERVSTSPPWSSAPRRPRSARARPRRAELRPALNPRARLHRDSCSDLPRGRAPSFSLLRSELLRSRRDPASRPTVPHRPGRVRAVDRAPLHS